VLSKLDVLVRYWQLVARHARTGGPGVAPLDQGEKTELLALMQLVGDVDVPPPASVPRNADAHPAQLIGEGTIRTVELRAMSPRALLIATPSPPAAGTRVLLRVADAVVGVEYVVPCHVEWVHAGAPAAVALVVDGLPTRTAFDAALRSDTDASSGVLSAQARDHVSFADRHTPLLG
jgi:hypothetical protein